MAYFDKDFIKNNRQEIISASFSNAERLLNEGRLLLNQKLYARSSHLFISGFEELAKALKVNNAESLTDGEFRKLIDHESKLYELLEFVSQDMLDDLVDDGGENIEVINIEEVRKIWSKSNKERSKKLAEILHETMYVGLSESTSRHGLEPNEDYWRNYANVFSLLLEDRIRRVKRRLGVEKN